MGQEAPTSEQAGSVYTLSLSLI